MADNSNGELDPQLAELLRAIRDSGAAPLYTLSPAEARAAYLEGALKLTGPIPAVDHTTDLQIAAQDGQVPVRLYYPFREVKHGLPLVVFFHGGGWSFGGIRSHDNVCRHLCVRAGCIVASVGYHLAPEYKFPHAVNDAIAASLWARDNVDRLGGDRARIVFAGDSAGANLAAVAAIAARDAGWTDVTGQLLIYPATDQTMSYPSHSAFGDTYRLTRPLMVWSSINYLRDGSDVTDVRASPLLANDLSGLAPAIIVTAGFDPLRDEGQAYADKLAAAGVEVEYRCFDNLIHGFINLTGVCDAAEQALDDIASMLKRKLQCHS